MMRNISTVVLALCMLNVVACESGPDYAPDHVGPAVRVRQNPAHGERIMLATVNPYATQAGLNAYAAGGNAIDAAIAAALTLGVVDPHNSGIGGGCFIVIHRANGDVLAIDGRETAPALASPDMYNGPDGKLDPTLSKTGALAVGTPSALAGYERAVVSAGKLDLAQLLAPAAELAEYGFKADAVLAARIERTKADLARFPAAAAIYLNPDGSPRSEGSVVKNPDLAGTYRAIAEHGTDWFYRGEFAQKVSQWMEANGGRLRTGDFAAYKPRLRRPVESTYRGYKVVGFPPPSSGGVHVAQILNICERFDLAKLHRENPADFVHVVAEAQKLAFADRAHWLGDPDFAKVPRGLIDKDYAAELAGRIDTKRAIKVERHGDPPRWESVLFGKHTTHIAAADSDGNVVAITATINTSFGSKVVVPGTGVVLNNEMDDFSLAPGVPNAFGLVGADANKIEPAKRPLSSMSPTLVFDPKGKPVLTVGAAGGPKIITQSVLTILRTIDMGLPVDEAVGAARFHHQWKPDNLYIERSMPQSVIADLAGRGHSVRPLDYAGFTQAIGIDLGAGRNKLTGVHDPRLSGSAAGD